MLKYFISLVGIWNNNREYKSFLAFPHIRLKKLIFTIAAFYMIYIGWHYRSKIMEVASIFQMLILQGYIKLLKLPQLIEILKY